MKRKNNARPLEYPASEEGAGKAVRNVGIVPETILFDNAKAASAERVGAAVNPLDPAQVYGFTPERRGFFCEREFRGAGDLSNQGGTRPDEMANAKVHGPEKPAVDSTAWLPS